MKIPNTRQLQQIIDFQGFMNFYQKYDAKPYSFLVIDTTLASDNVFNTLYIEIKHKA